MDRVADIETFEHVLAVETARVEDVPPSSPLSATLRTLEAQVAQASYLVTGERHAAIGSGFATAYQAAQRQYPTHPAPRRVAFDM